MELYDVEVLTMAGQTFLEWIAGTILLSGTEAAKPAATAVPIGTEYYSTNTQLRWKSNGATWIANSGAAGSAVVSVASVTLTDAQVKALPTTGIQVLAAPGAGIIRIPITAFLFLDWTANYTNINAAAKLEIQTPSGGDHLLDELANGLSTVSQLLAAGADRLALISLRHQISGTDTVAKDPASTTTKVNAASLIKSDNSGSGNFTGGNAANTLKVTTLYYDFTP